MKRSASTRAARPETLSAPPVSVAHHACARQGVVRADAVLSQEREPLERNQAHGRSPQDLHETRCLPGLRYHSRARDELAQRATEQRFTRQVVDRVNDSAEQVVREQAFLFEEAA